MKFLSQLLKAIGIFIAFMFVVSMAMIFYMPYHSSKVARAFCGSVRINEDLASLDERAKDGHINHTNSNDGGVEEHQFWVYGMFESMSMCKVKILNGKVVSKQVFDDG